MKKSAYLLVIFSLFIACKTRSDLERAGLKDWIATSGKVAQAISSGGGWSATAERPLGGRSWTVQDERDYDKWITTTVTSETLREWDIPVDCFDAAMVLRFIFAFERGLAFSVVPDAEVLARAKPEVKKTWEIANSIHFAQDPLALLRWGVMMLGTVDASKFSYPIDMFKLENYSSGSFYVIRDDQNSGHTQPLRLLPGKKLFSTLESTVPAAVRTLNEYDFFARQGTGIVDAGIRRFYAYRNENGRIERALDVSVMAHPATALVKYRSSSASSAPQFFADCAVENDDLPEPLKPSHDPAPLWMTLFNTKLLLDSGVTFSWENGVWSGEDPKGYLKREVVRSRGIRCPQNYLFQAEVSAYPRNKLVEAYLSLLDAQSAQICSSFQARVGVVVEGWNKCGIGQTARGSQLCSPGSLGAYSTPERDARLYYLMMQYANTVQLMSPYDPSVRLQARNFATTGCQVDPFFIPGNSGQLVGIGPKKIRPFFVDGDGLGYREWMQTFFIGGEESTANPQVALPLRWGCAAEDRTIKCIE